MIIFILDLRQIELEDTEVVIEGKNVDLRSFSCTTYGFDLLKACGIGTSCSLNEFNKLQQELLANNIAINRSSSTKGDFRPEISKGMREYMCVITDFNQDPASSLLSELN